MNLKNKISAIISIIAIIAISAISVSAKNNNNVITISPDSSTDYVGINIDGNYDDWEDKPHCPIHWGWQSNNVYHLGSLFRDDDYVYLKISMSPKSYSTFNGYNYRFKIDGKSTYVLAVPPRGQWFKNGNNDLVIRAQNGYRLISGANGVMTRQSNAPDKWELKIPLSFFSDQPDTIRTITFFCPNLGPQELIATGTPTLPYVIAFIALIFALIGYKASKKGNKINLKQFFKKES